MGENKDEGNVSLYCYKLDELTGEILRYEISPGQYMITKHSWNTDRDTFSFSADMGTGVYYRYNVLRRNLDKYVSHKVYTFDSDKDHVKSIIMSYLESKLAAAQNDVNRYSSVINRISKLRNEEN